MLILLAVLSATYLHSGAQASCACLGNNDGIPKSQSKYYGTAYGTSCRAWDMDYKYCGENNQKRDPKRACWCPGQWCYVDQFCDSARVSQFSNEVSMHFSYAPCGEDFGHCWDDDGESLGEEEYEDSNKVVYATRTKMTTTSTVLPLGKPEKQAWDFCYIDSCQFYGSVGRRRLSDLMMGIIPLHNPKMSQVSDDAPAERALDGFHDKTWWGDGSCISTPPGAQWWKADFGGYTHAVSEVRIWQRRDCCEDRVNNLQIRIGTELCVERTSGGGAGYNNFKCEGGTATGKDITVSTYPGGDPINICEIEVWGNVADNKRMDAVKSTGCKIVGQGENALGNTVYAIETEPYTAATVHCVKRGAFKKIRWISDGVSRGP